MRTVLVILVLFASASAKPKVIAFGRWTSVPWMVGADEKQALDLRVRPLLVNGEIKEYTVGKPHDVTDRVFVVQRAMKINDRLPTDPARSQWSWRPAGWLMVERGSARISKLSLPEYDALVASPVWFRDYIAYCAVSDTGDKIFAYVVQIGRRKPILKKLLGAHNATDANAGLPDSLCSRPVWQRQPVRVTFQPANGAPASFAIRNFATEIPPDSTLPEPATDEGQ